MTVIMELDRFTSICGYFYSGKKRSGYNCKHPDCGEIQLGEGWCHSWACPLGTAPDNEDFRNHGMDDCVDPIYEDEGSSDFILVWELPEKDFFKKGGCNSMKIAGSARKEVILKWDH